MCNAKSPSREAEILANKKNFKLKFNWYMEKKHVLLMTLHFLVPKVVEKGVVVNV